MTPCEEAGLPYKPLYYDGMDAVFSTAQIDVWGLPEGYPHYYVIESPIYVNDPCRVMGMRARPVHRYSRYERFKAILNHMMAMSGHVPDAIVEECSWCFVDIDPWEEVRRVLKANGWSLYYNRIPVIIKRLQELECPVDGADRIERILAAFRTLDAVFPALKAELGRAYFPNLRYVALRLMEMFGVYTAFDVPYLRTRKKVASVGAIFDRMVSIASCAAPPAE